MDDLVVETGSGWRGVVRILEVRVNVILPWWQGSMLVLFRMVVETLRFRGDGGKKTYLSIIPTLPIARILQPYFH